MLFKKQESLILNYWPTFNFEALLKKYQQTLYTKATQGDKNILQSANLVTLSGQCHWKWVSLKYNTYGKNGYPFS